MALLWLHDHRAALDAAVASTWIDRCRRFDAFEFPDSIRSRPSFISCPLAMDRKVANAAKRLSKAAPLVLTSPFTRSAPSLFNFHGGQEFRPELGFAVLSASCFNAISPRPRSFRCRQPETAGACSRCMGCSPVSFIVKMHRAESRAE